MARYVNPFPQYINISGSPINGGFLKFFDTGTDDPKSVFSDSDFATDIGNEVRLSASGRVPDIYLNGAYSVTLTDADGNELDSADPIGLDTDITNFDLWDISNTYNIPDIVLGSDDLYYQSIVDTNLGNDPTSQPSAFWEQFFFLPTWNTAQTYATGQISIGSDGRAYQSQLGSNTGNDPTSDDGTNWQILLQNDDDIDVAGLTISKLGANAASLTFQSDVLTSWLWDFDASENLSLDRYIAGTLQDTVLSIDNATGAMTLVSDVTLTQDANAVDLQMFLSADDGQNVSIEFQNAGIRRWEIGHNTTNVFSLTGYDNTGGNSQPIWFVNEDETDLWITSGNIIFNATDQGVDGGSANGGAVNFNFPNLSVNTEDTAFDFFDNTTTTGERLFNIYQGDGTTTVTLQIDAENGTIHTAFDRAAETDAGVKLGKIILSEDAPSGGEDGDLWLRF